MKEIMRFSHYEAEDDSIFSDRDQCKIYETILKNAPAFFSKHFKWMEPRDFRNPEKRLGFTMIKPSLSILLQMMNYSSLNVIWIDMV